MSLFFFNTREVVQMRRKAVEQAYQGHTRRHSGYYLPPLARSAHGGGRKYKAHYCRREHHARAEAEKHIIPFVWYPSHGKPYNRACERRQAETGRAYCEFVYHKCITRLETEKSCLAIFFAGRHVIRK